MKCPLCGRNIPVGELVLMIVLTALVIYTIARNVAEGRSLIVEILWLAGIGLAVWIIGHLRERFLRPGPGD